MTLGDDEARRRRTRKTIRERAAPPTFDAAIELLERRKWRVYPHLGNAVDQLLLGLLRLMYQLKIADDPLLARLSALSYCNMRHNPSSIFEPDAESSPLCFTLTPSTAQAQRQRFGH